MTEMAIKLCLLLCVIPLVSLVPQIPPSAGDPLRIGAFNIQVLGVAKLNKSGVVATVTKIIKRYDIMLIQEVRDSSNTVLNAILAKVNYRASSPNKKYRMVSSGRLGRTMSKEQYAFFYKPTKVTLKGTYQYPDRRDVFQREPFAVRFFSPNTAVTDFAIMAIHTSPQDAVPEVSNLTIVYNDLRAAWKIEDVLIAGDFNADCGYVQPDDWPNISLWTDKQFDWLLTGCADTTVSNTDCAYDRFVAAGKNLQMAVIRDSVSVYHFEKDLPRGTDAKDVSDHYPIQMELQGRYNDNVQKAVKTSESFSVENTIAATNVNDIRAIYKWGNEGYDILVLKKKTKMAMVIATQIGITDPVAEIEKFQTTFPKAVPIEVVSMVKTFIDAHIFDKHITGLKEVKRNTFNIEIKCGLLEPNFTCKVTVEKYRN